MDIFTVGGSMHRSRRAFLWRNDGTNIHDLNKLIDPTDPLKSFVTLTRGDFINDLSAGIHMSDIPSFPYALLWGERSICSVANLTRSDGVDFMQLASSMVLKPCIHVFPLEQANVALQSLRAGTLAGCAVLRIAE